MSAPAVTDATTHSVDLFPTTATLAGVSGEAFESDGVNLGPTLFNGGPLDERTLFWRAGTQAAVRNGRWKLYRQGLRTELYDLDNDLGEQHDLADEHPKLVRKLSAEWTLWETTVDASAAQYEQEANELESWMREKMPLASSTDYGKDEQAAETLLSRHGRLHGEIVALDDDIKRWVV